jgi:L-ribulose-5-phosphate 3-epimerase UlaE
MQLLGGGNARAVQIIAHTHQLQLEVIEVCPVVDDDRRRTKRLKHMSEPNWSFYKQVVHRNFTMRVSMCLSSDTRVPFFELIPGIEQIKAVTKILLEMFECINHGKYKTLLDCQIRDSLKTADVVAGEKSFSQR